MATPVLMPRQGQSVESCILTEWYKSEGDAVSQGDLLFAYETDKAAFEEEAPAEGILLARFYEEGDEVPVLVNTAVIGAEGDSVDEFRPNGAAAGESATAEATPVTAKTEEAETPVESKPDVIDISGTSAISPRAKKLAKDKRVVLAGLVGSGPGGRIIERDIQAEIKNGKRLTPLAQKKLEGEGLAVSLKA